MKKLFFLSFFMVGLFVTMQAQSLEYVVVNGTSNLEWDFKLADSNGNEMEELGIQPGEERTGVFANFAFDLFWKGYNSNNCGFNDQASGPVPETTVGVTCTPAASYTYKIVAVGSDFVFKIILE